MYLYKITTLLQIKKIKTEKNDIFLFIYNVIQNKTKL